MGKLQYYRGSTENAAGDGSRGRKEGMSEPTGMPSFA